MIFVYIVPLQHNVVINVITEGEKARDHRSFNVSKHTYRHKYIIISPNTRLKPWVLYKEK